MTVQLEEPDVNKKLIPQSPLMRLNAQGEGENDDGLYPNISGWATKNGVHFFRHENPENPDATVEEQLNADGSYRTSETSKKYKGVTSELSHQSHGYVSRGRSRQVDGHDDARTESTSRSVTAGDTGRETGRDSYSGTARHNIRGQGGNEVNITAPGSQKITITNNASPGGDNITNIAGNTHENLEGDHIRSVNGNKYTMVRNGDYGVHVQDKNIDFRSDSGKAQLRTGNDITIESDTKITLKVGQSTLVITSSSVTIKSPKIDFNP